MEHFERNLTPRFLYKKINGEYLFFRKGKQWKQRYEANANSAFNWGTVQFESNNINISKELSLLLQDISNERCHYCDRKQVRKGDVRATIDHFAPKTKKPLRSYYWSNLFLSCDSCQEYKSSKYSKKLLLKFDHPSYSFDDYFIIDFISGRILSRIDITPFERCRARYTLMVLGINSDRRTESRLEELQAFLDTIPERRLVNNFSFKFFITRATI